MTFNATTAPQLAAQASRGDLRALGTLLRDLIDHVDGLSSTELGFIDGVTAGTGAASKALVLDANGDVVMPSGGILGLSRATLAAAGTTAADAAVIAQQIVLVTGADNAKGVALPAAAATEGPILVINTAGAPLLVYPVNGGNDQINSLAEDAAFTMGPGDAAWFVPTSATQWYAANRNGVKSQVLTALATLTAADNGKTFFLNSGTEFAVTLPAPFLGAKFKFIVAAAPAAASYTIVTPASAQIIFGHNLTSDGNAADTEPTGGATTITFVDGQAVVGDMVELESDGTNWYARGTSAVPAGITLTG